MAYKNGLKNFWGQICQKDLSNFVISEEVRFYAAHLDTAIISTFLFFMWSHLWGSSSPSMVNISF